MVLYWIVSLKDDIILIYEARNETKPIYWLVILRSFIVNVLKFIIRLLLSFLFVHRSEIIIIYFFKSIARQGKWYHRFSTNWGHYYKKRGWRQLSLHKCICVLIKLLPYFLFIMTFHLFLFKLVAIPLLWFCCLFKRHLFFYVHHSYHYV